MELVVVGQDLTVLDGADAGDHHLIYTRGEGILLGGEDLLVELLAGAKTGVDDLDVLVRLQSGEADHVAGEVVDLVLFAHVEDVDLGICRHGGRLQDEAASLRDAHEVADDLRVGDGDGSALCDLLAEDLDDATLTAEDVAKAGGDKDGARLAGAIVDLLAKALDVHLCGTLAGTHDVGGVDRLVCGDHEHLFHVVLEAEVGDVAGADDVDEDALAGVFLHEWDVLVGGGVEDNLGAVLLKDVADAVLDADVTDDGDEVEVREGLLKVEAEVVERCLGVVEKDELADAEGGDLGDQLGADAAGSPGDEDDFAGKGVGDLGAIVPDLIPHEEVLYADALDALGGDGGGIALADTGHEVGMEPNRLAGVDEVLPLAEKVLLGGEDDALETVFDRQVRKTGGVVDVVDG